MGESMTRCQEIFEITIGIQQRLFADTVFHSRIESAANAIILALTNGGRVLFCGNGGSAADAQHLAAELSGRFYIDRKPLDAEALHVNTSFLTAVANDYSYDEIYARLVQAKGRPGDVLVGITTSGNSPNVLLAARKAKEIGMVVVGMTGETGGQLAAESNFLLNVPSADTPRIQESHIIIGHTLCELVEARLFG